jgi:hypothetical protein
MFGDEDGNLINATFYKMNAAGDGYEKYENYVMLAPGEGALVQYSTSGKVYYYSDEQGWTIASSGTAINPLLPAHGETTNQDANVVLTLANDDSEMDADNKNSALIEANDGKVANVTLADRTLYKDGYWNTLTLPFDVNDLSGTPLAGATLMELNGTTSNLTGTTLTLNFKDSENGIVAGVPYIIKWTSGDNIVNPVFTGVTIDKDASTEVSFDGGKFVGIYNPVTYNTETKSILFVGVDEETNESKLYWPNPADAEHPVVINAFRAYFDVADGSKIRSFRLNLGENGGEATGILSMDNGQLRMENDSWYSVDGRKLLNAPKRKGVYIHNGVKVTIK